MSVVYKYLGSLQLFVRQRLAILPGTPVEKAVVNAAHSRRPLTRFKAAFGSLKGKQVFGNDAVKFQQEMREEWQ